MICYQCEKEVNYLFEDSCCKDCTRLTPEELLGKAAFLAGCDFGTSYYGEGYLGTPERTRGYLEWNREVRLNALRDDGEKQAAALSEIDR